MSISTKGRHKLRIGSQLYLWWVAEDYDLPVFFLRIVSDDKKFDAKYQVGQSKSREYRFWTQIKSQMVTIQDHGVGRLLRTPLWQDDLVITPSFVRRLLDWYMESTTPKVEINWRDEIISNNEK